MVDILKNIMNIAYRVRDMQIAGTLSMALFGVVLVFGIMNCVLGYRLLRFWMMTSRSVVMDVMETSGRCEENG